MLVDGEELITFGHVFLLVPAPGSTPERETRLLGIYPFKRSSDPQEDVMSEYELAG